LDHVHHLSFFTAAPTSRNLLPCQREISKTNGNGVLEAQFSSFYANWGWLLIGPNSSASTTFVQPYIAPVQNAKYVHGVDESSTE
jgi:hypothetical protein